MKRFRTVALMAGLAALALPASSFGAGLPQSSAEPGAASGSPIDLGQLLTLGKSNSSKDSSKTNVLTLAGLDLLTKNGNVSGQATNSGLLAPVGDIVDALNGALCPAGPVDETGLCLSVLHSNASGDVESDDLGTRKRNNSSFATLVLTLGDQGIYVLGSAHPWVSNLRTNFLLCTAAMALFAVALHRLFLDGKRTNIYVMLLIGVLAGTLFDSLASFLVVLIDPNEFLIIQSRMFASFNRVTVGLLWPAALMSLAVLAWAAPALRYLDVLALGRDHAVSLGVDYPWAVRRLLIAVFLLVAVSTALVGPITFLGLIVANLAYELLDTYRRGPLMAASALGGVIALVGGQLVLEHLLVFSVPLPVLINFAGGMLFMYLLLKERSAW